MMKLFWELGSPFTLNDPSRGSPALDKAERWTPGASRLRSEYARPFSGMFTITSLLTTWPLSVESLSTTAAAPVTVMDSVVAPTWRVRSTRWRALTATLKGLGFAEETAPAAAGAL